ncbi:hypothetical protein EOPP23_16230 [Endozoicomonas sp. OPT23]|nr:hypothetical protein [Endozoicomonas sp. OPT23]
MITQYAKETALFGAINWLVKQVKGTADSTDERKQEIERAIVDTSVQSIPMTAGEYLRVMMQPAIQVIGGRCDFRNRVALARILVDEEKASDDKLARSADWAELKEVFTCSEISTDYEGAFSQSYQQRRRRALLVRNARGR